MATKDPLKPFTMAAIERLTPAEPGDRDTYPHPKIQGLKLRVTDGGARSFVLEGRIKGGGMIRMTIGAFPSCTVELAEAEAKRLTGLMIQGIDPRKDKRKAKTFGELFDWYIGQPGKRKASTEKHYRWLYDTYLEALGKRDVAAITRTELRALHAKLTRDNGAYGANRALVLVKSVFNAAAKDERFDGVNPAQGIEMNREESREVRLLPSQLGAFLAAVENYPDQALRDFFILCLLTGQRRSNLQAMRWTDVHLADRLWIVPETKNGKPQNVPLLEAEVAILERRKKGSKSPWVFPTHSKTGHLVEPKNAWKAILGKAGIKYGDLRIHDLRRTLGSLMGDAGVSLPTIGKTLGHMSQLTTAIYARLCLDPVREAKEKAHATIATAGAKVEKHATSQPTEPTEPPPQTKVLEGKVVSLASRRKGASR